MKAKNAATLAKYVNRIGLPLTAKQDELFELEVRPMIEAATTIRDRFELADGWRRVNYTRSGTNRFFAKGKITLAKERILQALLRKLRSAEAVAVGRRALKGKLGPLEIIDPMQWSKLTMSWGENTVTCDDVAFNEIHVAMMDRMGQAPREHLLELLFRGDAAPLRPRAGEGGKGGAPRKKSLLVEAWIAEAQSGSKKMPKDIKAGRAKALAHFEAKTGAEKASKRTIYRVLDEFYSGRAKPARGHN